VLNKEKRKKAGGMCAVKIRKHTVWTVSNWTRGKVFLRLTTLHLFKPLGYHLSPLDANAVGKTTRASRKNELSKNWPQQVFGRLYKSTYTSGQQLIHPFF